MKFIPKFHKLLSFEFLVYEILILFPCVVIILMTDKIYPYSIEFQAITQLIISSLLFLFYFLISWIILNLIEKNVVYEKENENYYRELIKTISPAELSYIDDYNTEIRKDILSTILMLHLKGNIKITKDKITFVSKFKLKEGSYYNLSKTESMVLNLLETKESPFKLPYKFHELLLEDLLDKQLIENTLTTPPHFKTLFYLRIVFGILSIIISLFTKNLILPYFGIMLFLVSYILQPNDNFTLKKDNFFLISTKSAYNKLTPKGNEIRLKLTGLKLFLKDYSDMKNKELQELELWDEYLIYSVILNDNKKIQKKLYKMIQNYLKS